MYYILYMAIYAKDLIVKKNISIIHTATILTSMSLEVVFIALFYFYYNLVSLPHVITQLFAALLLAGFRVSHCVIIWVGREGGKEDHTQI